VPGASEPSAAGAPSHREVHRGHVLFAVPKPPVAIGLLLLASFVLALLFFYPSWTRVVEGWILVFAGPALVAAAVTTPATAALGGRFEFHRSVFLALACLLLVLPLALVWIVAYDVWPSAVPSLLILGAFLTGPILWFRHMSLFGVSRASHARMLPVSLVQPLLGLAGFFVLVPPTVVALVAAAAFLVIGFGTSVVLLRAADRPMRREFQTSGVALIRPLLDHVGSRDPQATAALEGFFLKTAIPADLKVSLLSFFRGGRAHATVALPTVHPGPFAALGASDLPRKLAEQLGPEAGTVLVPHTPCDHDLDLPSGSELEKVGSAAQSVLRGLATGLPARASPLVAPYAGSLARAQLIGDVALVIVSQAPQPTDDIAYSVADHVVGELAREGGPRVALVDAHNSYIEGQGDIVYATPTAEKLLADARAAVRAAVAEATDGPIEVGVAVRSGYSIGDDGIGSQGMRALVVRTGGTTTGYLLIDGNNLLVKLRDPIVKALETVVTVGEVMTTDNHVVHEVDGGINPLGERHSIDAFCREAKEVMAAAVADLGPAEPRFGSADVPSVKVLGPGHTARLLTSLGDTLSMFTNMFAATFLLLLAASLAVAFALR
jgi:putative membrane protein